MDMPDIKRNKRRSRAKDRWRLKKYGEEGTKYWVTKKDKAGLTHGICTKVVQKKIGKKGGQNEISQQDIKRDLLHQYNSEHSKEALRDISQGSERQRANEGKTKIPPGYTALKAGGRYPTREHKTNKTKRTQIVYHNAMFPTGKRACVVFYLVQASLPW
jgi:hypothetical protein